MRESTTRAGLYVLSFVLGVLWVGVAAAQPPLKAPPSLDEEFLRMAEEFPGFGGLYHDENGTPHVFLTDMSQLPRLKVFNEDIQAHPGEFDFRELSKWRQSLMGLMRRPGVVFLDVDETRNRVVLGVEPGSPAANARAMEREIEGLGVPSRAVEIVETDPIFPRQTVQSTIRPVPGGVEIGFLGQFACTYGVTLLDSAGRHHFLTNSHCSRTQCAADGTVYTQNFFGPRIGQEVFDPACFVGGPCPGGRRCRYSDVLVARCDSNALCQRFHIAVTVAPLNLNIGFWFIVNGKTPFPSVGQVVMKTGRTTGTTHGTVAQTCANVNVAGTNITMLCQDIVTNPGMVIMQGGDSGSPVFRDPDWYMGEAWGSNNFGDVFVFSAVANIEFEIGPINF